MKVSLKKPESQSVKILEVGLQKDEEMMYEFDPNDIFTNEFFDFYIQHIDGSKFTTKLMNMFKEFIKKS